MPIFGASTRKHIKNAIADTFDNTADVIRLTLLDTDTGQKKVKTTVYTAMPIRLARIKPDESMDLDVILSRRLFHAFMPETYVILDSDEMTIDGINYKVESYLGPKTTNDYIGRAVIARLGDDV